MSDKVIMRTPKATAKYIHVTHPDTRFDEQGKYSVDLVLDAEKNEEHKKFLAELWALTKKKHPNGRPPFKPELDDGGNKTGNYLVKIGSAYKPKVFDASGEIIPSDIIVGPGSELKVAFQPNYYDGFGGGMNLYLKAVQVLSLVEGGAGSAEAYGFDVNGSSASTEPDDNMPF